MSYMYQHTKKLFLLLFAVLGMHQAMAQSPTITNQPSNQSGCAGANVSFFVTANNATAYQWQVNQGSGFLPISNGGVYSGATTSNLSITGISAGMNGYLYRCVVTGLTPPSVTSNAATLTISVPSITSQPSNATACTGSSANFSITAAGTGLTYQWMENQGSGFVALSNNATYAGTNTSSLTISGATLAMNGYTYECLVSGTCTPPTTSSVASLSIITAPSITAQPVPVSICEASNTSFSVSASGLGLTYQWMVNQGSGFIAITDGALYSGTTTATLNITAATATMNGYTYECVVSGACAPPAITTPATLSVTALPVISTQPAASSICVGNNTSFSVTTVGSFNYQWQVNQGAGFVNVSNGGVYTGANASTLNITGATAGMNGYTYQCVITNSTCSVTTVAVALTVNTAPIITGQPSNSSICVGANTTFSVTASGVGVSYQWQLSTGGPFSNVSNGGVYSGATSATLTISGATAGMNNTVYNCIVTGTCAPAATSNNATLTVKALPTITTQPNTPAAICAGGNINIAIVAPGLTYQWQVNQGAGFVNVVNGGNYAGDNTATLSITGATAAFNGNQYQCVVTNAGNCSLASNSVTTTVNSSPAITTQPAATAICAGGIGNMSVVATGAGLTYQWQAFVGAIWTNIPNGAFLGTTVSGANTSTITFTGVTAAINNTNIRVIVTGTCNPAVTSAAAVLTVNALPAITVQPTNKTVCANGATTFNVTATGAGLTYQWQENQGAGFVNISDGGIYSGTATSALVLTGVTQSMSGYTYQCIVSGTCAPAVTSNTASLTINPATVVTSNPVAVTLCAPATTTFAVTATGTGVLTYQWQVSTNGGATYSNLTNTPPYSNVASSILTITNGAVGLNGNLYQCVVTSPTCGSATSTPALLTVNAATAVTGQPAPSTICAGGNASFVIVAAGSGLTYQWQVNMGAGFLPLQDTGLYSGSLTNSLTLTNVGAPLNGYIYNCVVTGTCAPLTVTSNPATLTVNTAPFITSNPVSVFACVGTNVNFTASATGTALTYQWQLSTNGGVTWNNLANGGGYANVTAASMSFTGVTAAMTGYQYRIIVSGTCTPKDTSTAATLTINSATPVITTQPVNTNACAGNNVTFSVVAGNGNLTYQWQVSTNAGVTWNNIPVGAPYSGVTTNTLTISGLPIGYGGYQYRAVVRSVCPPFTTTNSNAAILTIETPNITSQPVNTNVCVGNLATFTVVASGTYLTYQWQADSNGTGIFYNLTDNTIITGSQTAILNITSALDSLNGYRFRCLINGLCPTGATSTSATLTVNDISTWIGPLPGPDSWSNPTNWSCGSVPNQYTNVIIPAGTGAANVDITTAIAHDITVNAGATLNMNAGSILTVKGSLLPSTAAIFNPIQGKVIFSGTGLQYVPSANYLDLQMDNTGLKKLNGSITVADKLTMLEGLLVMGNNDVTLGPLATVVGGGPVSYLVTNGSGMIVDQNIGIGGKVQFEKLPVGPSVIAYNPISIHNTGVADAFKIMVLDSIYFHYFGIAPSSLAMKYGAVNRTWIVEESVPGGSIATVKVQWNAADELPGFDRNISYLSQYVNPNWTIDTGGMPLGFNPYTDTLTAVTDFTQYKVAFGVINGTPPPASVVSASKEGGIVVYPNPVSGDQIYVRITNTTSDVHIRITDVLGKVWSVTEANPANHTLGTIPMNVANLPSGLYILQVIDSSNNTVQSVKFNKE